MKCGMKSLIHSETSTVAFWGPIQYKDTVLPIQGLDRLIFIMGISVLVRRRLYAESSPGWFCCISWWRHQMETFSALLAFCARNSPVTGEFPHKGQWRWALILYLICALNKRLSKQPWGRRFWTPSLSLWRHCNFHPSSLTHSVRFICNTIYSLWHQTFESIRNIRSCWSKLLLSVKIRTIIDDKNGPFRVMWVLFVVQVHLHNQHDIANVNNVGVAASLSAHTLLEMTYVQASTVRWRYNAANCLQNPHKWYLIARPWGWAMGCLLWF